MPFKNVNGNNNLSQFMHKTRVLLSRSFVETLHDNNKSEDRKWSLKSCEMNEFSRPSVEGERRGVNREDYNPLI